MPFSGKLPREFQLHQDSSVLVHIYLTSQYHHLHFFGPVDGQHDATGSKTERLSLRLHLIVPASATFALLCPMPSQFARHTMTLMMLLQQETVPSHQDVPSSSLLLTT